MSDSLWTQGHQYLSALMVYPSRYHSLVVASYLAATSRLLAVESYLEATCLFLRLLAAVSYLAATNLPMSDSLWTQGHQY
jgi:hypothetical protein